MTVTFHVKYYAWMLNPIHTIVGYSQWIVTRVIELKSALVHTTAENRRSKSSFDYVCLIIMYKTSEWFIISICYLVPIKAMLKLKRLKAAKWQSTWKKQCNGIALVFLLVGASCTAIERTSNSVRSMQYTHTNFSIATAPLNPLTATTAIWRFGIVTHAAICLTPSDMFLYVFLYPVRLF